MIQFEKVETAKKPNFLYIVNFANPETKIFEIKQWNFWSKQEKLKFDVGVWRVKYKA